MDNEILVDESTGFIHADDGGAPEHCVKYTRTPPKPTGRSAEALQRLFGIAKKKHSEHREFANKCPDPSNVRSTHHGAANGFEIMEGLLEEALESAQPDMVEVDVEELKREYPRGHERNCVCARCMKIFSINGALDDLKTHGYRIVRHDV